MDKIAIIVDNVRIVKFYNEEGEGSKIILEDNAFFNVLGEELAYIKVKLTSHKDVNYNIKFFSDQLEDFDIKSMKDIKKIFKDQMVFLNGTWVEEGETKVGL